MIITFGQSGTRPYCTLEVVQVSQSVANNTSTVSFTLTLKRPYAVSSSATKQWSVIINGTTYRGSGSIGGSGDKVLLSGTQVIPHNADGTKTFGFSGSCQLDITWSGVPLGTISGSGTMTLTPIPKYAVISQNATGKTETTITMNWASDSIVDYLWYSTDNGSSWSGIDIADGTKGTYTISNLSPNTTYNIKTRVRRKDSQLTSDSSALAVTTYAFPYALTMPDFTLGAPLTLGIFNPLNRSVVVTLLAQNNTVVTSDVINGQSITGYTGAQILDRLYASIPNSQFGNYKVKVTYGVHEDTKTGGKYIVNASDCAPEVSAVAYEDINPNTLLLTENNQDIVQNHSIVDYSASGLSGQKYATITSCQVEVNGETYSLTLDGTSASGHGDVINSGTDVEAVFTITDSRGLITTKSITIHMLEWMIPSAIIECARQHNFYSDTDITVDAKFADINGNNEITITYEATKEGDSQPSVSGTLQDNVTSTIQLDNLKEWSISITLTDSLGGTVTYNIYLPKGMPIVFFDRLKSSVGVNSFPAHHKSFEIAGELYINDNVVADYVIEQGTSNGWFYRKYASGNVEAWCQYTIASSEITWNAYLSTGLVYGNTRVNYPFNIYNAVINATLNYCGGSVGWVSTANALDDAKTSVTMVRNGTSGDITINIEVKGQWRQNS